MESAGEQVQFDGDPGVRGRADQDCAQRVRRIRRVEEGRENCGAGAAKDDVDESLALAMQGDFRAGVVDLGQNAGLVGA